VITPHLRGLQNWKHLSAASSLCGACTEACPVKIDLHHHLLHNRRNAARAKPAWWEKIAFGMFALAARSPFLFQLGMKAGQWTLPIYRLIDGTALQGSVVDPLQSWTRSRNFPAAAAQSFHAYWRNRKGKS
jgi:L-lactate dehydrogenase complex protein LldF